MKVKVLTVYIEDTGDQLRVITDTPNYHKDSGYNWDGSSPYMDGESAAADTIRNHVLGVVADLNWQSWVYKAVSKSSDKNPS